MRSALQAPIAPSATTSCTPTPISSFFHFMGATWLPATAESMASAAEGKVLSTPTCKLNRQPSTAPVSESQSDVSSAVTVSSLARVWTMAGDAWIGELAAVSTVGRVEQCGLALKGGPSCWRGRCAGCGDVAAGGDTAGDAGWGAIGALVRAAGVWLLRESAVRD